MRSIPRISILIATLGLLVFLSANASAAARALPDAHFQEGVSTDTPIPTVAIETATPAADGSITHVVQYGQTLIMIASAYGIKLTDLRAMNGKTDDYITVGDALIIRLPVTPTITSTATQDPTPTRRPTSTRRPPAATPTITQTPTVTPTPSPTSALLAFRNSLTNQKIGIGLVAICAIGLVLVGLTFFRAR
jgi:LysM repeat protein